MKKNLLEYCSLDVWGLSLLYNAVKRPSLPVSDGRYGIRAIAFAIAKHKRLGKTESLMQTCDSTNDGRWQDSCSRWQSRSDCTRLYATAKQKRLGNTEPFLQADNTMLSGRYGIRAIAISRVATVRDC